MLKKLERFTRLTPRFARFRELFQRSRDQEMVRRQSPFSDIENAPQQTLR
jgi:hypothetical protein